VSGAEAAAAGAQKKTLHASERDTSRVRALRGHYKKRVAAVTVDAATDTDVFGAFVHDALVPVLRPGDVVVWDGLSAHRSEQVRREVERARATLLPLPPYSPDLSPIEPCWSKVKGHVRDVAPRTTESLGHAAAEGFASITAADARGWFKNCGYRVY
jgi:transposase